MILLSLLLFLLLFLIIISIITFIHELGHFLVAKYNKVRVAELSIGFGPLAYSFNRNGTTYSLRWLPLGGYVSVLDQNVIAEIERIKSAVPPLTFEQKQMIEKKLGGLTIDEDYKNQKTIENISHSRRALFALGGVIFNFLAIFSMFFILNMTYGREFRQDAVLIENAVIYESSSGDYLEQTTIIIDEVNYYVEGSNGEKLFINETGYNNVNSFLKNDIKESYTFSWSEFEAENSDSQKFLGELYFVYDVNNNGVYEPTDLTVAEMGKDNIYFQIGYASLDFGVTANSSYLPFFSESTTDAYAVFIYEIYYDDPNTSGNDHYNLSFYPFFYSSSSGNLIDLKNDSVNIFVSYYNTSSNFIVMEYIIPYPSFSVFNSNDNYVEYSEYYQLNLYQSFFFAFIDSCLLVVWSFLWLINVITFDALFSVMDTHDSSSTDSGDEFWFSNFYLMLMEVMILLSALVIIFNIIPIPPLDGWRFFEYSYEGIRKKKIKKSTSSLVAKIGWILIIIYFLLYLFFV